MELTLEFDSPFEQQYAEVLAFVIKNNHASCFDMMREFHINYAKAVNLMNTLESRDIVDEAFVGTSGPRPLLTEEGRVLKKKRQQLEQEEKKREAEKPKVESLNSATPSVEIAHVELTRTRTKLRKNKS